ncbi:PATL5 [Linum grandiflorum]
MVQQQEEIIALQQFKQLLLDEKSRSPDSASDEIYFCGVRLELDAIDERTDVILLKFLRANKFEVQDAFKMFSHTILWRKKFGIDKLLLEDEDYEYSKAFEKVFFMSGRSREGHPMWYMLCGAFDKELYDKAYSDEVKKQRFLKWRIVFIEKAMRKLDFRDGGISSIILVIDMENSRDLEKTAFEALKSINQSLLNYYPEFLEKRIIINVPWLPMTLMRIRRPFLAPGRYDKIVSAGRSGSRETLLRKRSESHDSVSDEIYFCGVRLELDAIDERTDVILLKFLRAKDFEVEDAFKMFSRAILWRKKFGIDKLLLEDEDREYSNTFGRAFFMSGRSREGHSVLYMVCGAFVDKELYYEAFFDEAKKERFLKWRIMFIEKTMRKLDFRVGGISSIVLVIDMENSIDLERTAFEALKSVNSSLLNYYPEFVERRILINVSWMDMALMTIRRPLSASGKFDKVVFARGSGCRETLLSFAIYYIWNNDSGKDSENINAQDFVENCYLRFMARMSTLLYYVLQIGYNIFCGVFPGNIWPIFVFLCGVVSEGTLAGLVYKSPKTKASKMTISIIFLLFILVAAPLIAMFVYTYPSDARSNVAKYIILAMSVVILAPSVVELKLLVKGMKYKAIAPVWYYVAGVVGNGCLFVNSLSEPWLFPARHCVATLLCGAVLIMFGLRKQSGYTTMPAFEIGGEDADQDGKEIQAPTFAGDGRN